MMELTKMGVGVGVVAGAAAAAVAASLLYLLYQQREREGNSKHHTSTSTRPTEEQRKQGREECGSPSTSEGVVTRHGMSHSRAKVKEKVKEKIMDKVREVETSVPSVKCDLFGGAFVCSLPCTFRAANETVPNNQEVFMDDVSDASLFVEINEIQSVADEDACKFFLDDLASCNRAIRCDPVRAPEAVTPSDRPTIPDTCYVGCMVADQHIQLDNDEKKRIVRTHFGLIRLRERASDILVIVCGACVNAEEERKMEVIFKRALASFCIVDDSIF